jgi:hypothetical protein
MLEDCNSTGNYFVPIISVLSQKKVVVAAWGLGPIVLCLMLVLGAVQSSYMQPRHELILPGEPW